MNTREHFLQDAFLQGAAVAVGGVRFRPIGLREEILVRTSGIPAFERDFLARLVAQDSESRPSPEDSDVLLRVAHICTLDPARRAPVSRREHEEWIASLRACGGTDALEFATHFARNELQTLAAAAVKISGSDDSGKASRGASPGSVASLLFLSTRDCGLSLSAAAATPLSQLIQLVHAALTSQGVKTEWAIPFPGELDALRARVERLKRQRTTDN